MPVCLSTNGPSTHTSATAPTKLLVATTHGVGVIERDGKGAPWRLTGRVMEDKHVSSLMAAPDNGGIFAGIHNGGIFHSSDDGATWQRRANGLTIEHVFSLAFQKDESGVTLYAGTEPVSLFKSRDNGATWVEFPTIGKVPGHENWTFPPPPHLAHTKTLLFDPRDPDVFYVAIEQGALLKTRDGGKTWTELASFDRPGEVWQKDIHRIVCRPSNPDELYMIGGMGFFCSYDAGETWEQRTDMQFRIGYPDQLILAPDDDSVMFMSGAERDPSTWRRSHKAHGTVLRTRDGGRSWEDANQGLPNTGRANIEALNAVIYPGGYALFAGNTDGEVYSSEDGGQSWSRIASGLKPVSKGGHFRNLQEAVA